MRTTKTLKKQYGSIVVPQQQTMAQWLEAYEGRRAAEQAEWRRHHGPFQRLGGWAVKGRMAALCLVALVELAGCLAPGSESNYRVSCVPTKEAPADVAEETYCGGPFVVCPLVSDGNQWLVGSSATLSTWAYDCECVPVANCSAR